MGANSKAYAKAWRARNRERLAAYARERYRAKKRAEGGRGRAEGGKLKPEFGSRIADRGPRTVDQLALAKQCVISAVVGLRDGLAQYVTALVERLVAERAEVVAYQAVATALGQAELRLTAETPERPTINPQHSTFRGGNGSAPRHSPKETRRAPAGNRTRVDSARAPAGAPLYPKMATAQGAVQPGASRSSGVAAATICQIPDEPIDSGEDITSRAIARCKREAAAKPHLVDAMRHEVNVLRGKKRARQLQEARE